MNDLASWFTGLATISGLAYFVLGFATAYAVHCIRQKMHRRQVELPWQLAGIAIGTVAILVVSIQSSNTYHQLQDCSKQFHGAILINAQISRENDQISQDQRRVIWVWLHDIIYPPEPFDHLQPDDPQRQAWGLGRTIAADHALAHLFDKQNALQQQRDAHPFPDPTCGQ